MEIKATFTRKVKGLGDERLAKLLEQITTQGDHHEQVTVQMHSLSEEKRATICDEIIHHFTTGAGGQKRMIPSVEFQFAEPYPLWPSSSSKSLEGKQAKHPSIGSYFLSADETQWGLENKNSRTPFELSIHSNPQQTEVHKLGIYAGSKILQMPPPPPPRASEPNCPSSSPSSSSKPALLGDLLAAGLLGPAIIQHLPWRKRVQVEGVCRRWQREALFYGWGDWREFSCPSWGGRKYEVEESRFVNKSTWEPVLNRVCHHITTLDMSEVGGKTIKLAAVLPKCPKLKHLAVGLYSIDEDALVGDVYKRFQSLECLRLEGGCEIVFPFPTAMLVNICQLMLHYCCSLLDNERNIDYRLWNITTLPCLRSLKLRLMGSEDLSFLGRMPHLEHLEFDGGYSAPDGWIHSFLEALPHLLGSAGLRALDLQNLPLKWISRIIAAITAGPTQLEHIGMCFKEKMEEVVKVKGVDESLGQLASPHLASLRSLSLNLFSLYHYTIDEWGWLEEICRQQRYLEYLELRMYHTMALPPSTICSIIRNGKNLRALKLFEVYFNKWSAGDLHALVEAAGSNADRRGMSSTGNLPPSPTLNMAFNEFEKVESSQIADSRLRIVAPHSPEVESHVLNHYRFGCLSTRPLKLFRSWW